MTPTIRNARADEFHFAFEVKRDAMGLHIKAKWGWDEEFQIDHHARRWAERTWSIISLGEERIGTIALDWKATHLQLGEFYILAKHRGRGLGTEILEGVLICRSTRAPTAGHLARQAVPAYPAPRGQGVHPSSPG